MGAIAQQAQGRQMVEMTPKKNLQMLMKKSWPRIASVVGNNISPRPPLPDVRQRHQQDAETRGMLAAKRALLLHDLLSARP